MKKDFGVCVCVCVCVCVFGFGDFLLFFKKKISLSSFWKSLRSWKMEDFTAWDLSALKVEKTIQIFSRDFGGGGAISENGEIEIVLVLHQAFNLSSEGGKQRNY